MLAKKQVFLLIFSFIMGSVLIGGGVYFVVSKSASAFNNDNINTAIQIGEIYAGNKTFNNANYTTLLNSLFDGGAIPATLNTPIKASDIRTRNVGKSVIVRLGGLDWIVTYISKDNSNNTIATLWLADSAQLPSNYRQSAWSNGFYDSGTNKEAPCNLYGRSYIRATALNNGGLYWAYSVNGSNDKTNVKHMQDETSIYAPFTMDNPIDTKYKGIKNFIVSPKNVSWQETQTPGRNNDGLLNGGIDGYGDYVGIEGYADWGDDKLWLPSLTETGHNDIEKGIWDTNSNERSNSGLWSWLRSTAGGNSCGAYYIVSSGNGAYGDMVHDGSVAVRPALHLNLNLAAKYMDSKIEYVPEIYDGNYSFNYTNFSNLTNLILGETSVNDFAGTKMTSEIRAQNSGRSVIVRLGGLDWIVTYISKDKKGNTIATLWLADSALLPAEYQRSTFGNSTIYYGVNDPSQGVPTNMYGTSFVRAKSLNNGGNYINIISNTANPTAVDQVAIQDKSHIFAPFTMGNPSQTEFLGINEFIVTPEQVSWQENGESAKNTLGFGFDCSNENWSTDILDTDFYPGYNLAKKPGSDTWKNDKLWLPSLTEIGYNGNSHGFWSTHADDRSNQSLYFTRSAADYGSFLVWDMSLSGTNYGGTHISNIRALRPAFHLNLTDAFQSTGANITLDSQGGIGGTENIEFTNNYVGEMPEIILPTKENFEFAGYNSSSDGQGVWYYNADGAGARNWDGSNGAITLYAIWRQKYNLSVVSAEGGSVTVLLDNIKVTESKIAVGAQLTLISVLGTDFAFVGWQAEGIALTPEQQKTNPLSFTMPNNDVKITAVLSSSLIKGINVIATLGGLAYVVGDDFESLSPGDLLTFVTKQTLPNYLFVGWRDKNGAFLRDESGNIITDQSIRITYQQAKDNLFTAVYQKATNDSLNDSTDNDC